jgi:phosphate uptake regulator
MNLENKIGVLRVQLISMARVSQRAVDYSIKGYTLGSAEFSRQARSGEREMEERHRCVKDLCHLLMAKKMVQGQDYRFTLVALRLGGALHTTYDAAMQMMRDTLFFLEMRKMPESPAWEPLAEMVNSLVRLCIVGLSKGDARHAETVLEAQEVWRRCELIRDEELDDDATVDAKAIFEKAIARSLGVIARQAHNIADAILYWLKEREYGTEFAAREHDRLSHMFAGIEMYAAGVAGGCATMRASLKS